MDIAYLALMALMWLALVGLTLGCAKLGGLEQ
jgi:hypothetical protein